MTVFHPTELPAGSRPVITGLGMTEMGKVYGRTSARFAADAVRLAAADAGIALGDIDGLLLSSGIAGHVGLPVQRDLGLTDLSLLAEMQSFGATAAQMIQYASMAVVTGTATTVACVWADTPLRQGRAAGAAHADARMPGWTGITNASGLKGANPLYALAARRHMNRFGTTNDHFGAIAVAQRDWAAMNPLAQLRTPLSMEEYHASRWVVEPFHLLDCCLVSNGGVAVIVTAADRATDAKPAVGVLGWGQAHPGTGMRRDDDFGIVSGAATSGPKALAMAGVALSDVDLVELYDCYTFTALLTLEDYGFCEKGEGGRFVSEPGLLGPKGSLKLNTGGGQLSSYYMWGMTPISEAIIQARGEAGERQVDKTDVILVSGNGGILDHHSTLVLSGRA